MDWGQERPSRKSIFGLMLMCSKTALSWCFKQHFVVAQSSKEAEFFALASCIKQVLWLKTFASSLKLILPETTADSLLNICIEEDSQACISKSNCSTLSKFSKYVDLDFQLIVYHVRKCGIKLIYLSTENTVSNIFTNNLPLQKSNHLLALIGIETYGEQTY